MNIQKLLKKLDKNSLENKKQLLTVQAAYKLKTSQSIGTLNSLADHNERSFVISDAVTPQNRKFHENDLSANSKLDEQLSNIEKMKNLYQSRQNRNRVRNKSYDRNSASGNKSSEKHLLKPSNTPSFNKIQKPKIVHQNDSACKNLYTEQMLQNSQTSQISQTNQISTSKTGDRKHYFQYPDSSLHVQQQDQEPYEQQPSYNSQTISHIANISQQIAHETSTHNHHKKAKQNMQITWQQASTPQPICQTNRFKSSVNQNSTIHQNSTSCQCFCMSREQINALMIGFEKKIQFLSAKVQNLEIENQAIKNKQILISSQNQKYQQALAEVNEEKQRALEQVKKQMNEKQQLQILLKDVLYKRQRQKLQNSKQNTFRQNEKSEKRPNNFSFVQSQSTSELKPTRISSSSGLQPRQSQSKMKVQNLLQKLHIKVDRA